MTIDRDNARALIAEARWTVGASSSGGNRKRPLLNDLADALEAALNPPQIDRDALALVIAKARWTEGKIESNEAVADAVIAHLNLQATAAPVEGDRCICTGAIAGISDGPNVDCPVHGEPSPVEGEVEWEYRAKIGRIYGEPRADYENAVLAVEEAYADYPFEVEDDSVTVYRRPRLGWEVAP